MIRVARLVVLVCLIAGTSSGAQAQSAAVSICGQIVSGEAHLTNDLDCPPTFAGSVIVQGGSLDLRGFTIRGGEVGVYCVHPIWEENVFIYKKCRVFGGTIADYAVAGVAAKKLALADVTLAGQGIAAVSHTSLQFANLTIDMAPEPHNIGIFTRSGGVKGTNLSVQGGTLGIWAGKKVDVDGMSASGAVEHAIRGNGVRLRNASLTGGGAGITSGKSAILESSTITGHTNTGVKAPRVKLIGTTVASNGLDIDAERVQLRDGSSCETSSLGVCSAD